MGYPNAPSCGHQIKDLEVRVCKFQHHGGGVEVSRNLFFNTVKQIGLGQCSDVKEVRQNFERN